MEPKELGIEPTERNTRGVAMKVKLETRSCAYATLKNLSKSDAEYYTSDEWVGE